GGWTAPEPASFSGEYDDVNPFIRPDGQALYFSSRRPPAGSDTPRAHYQIWFVERAGAGWSDPSELALPLESAGGEMSPTLTRDGTLYYVADYPSLDGEGVYRAPLAGGEYGMPERLDFLLNTGQVVEVEPFVAPDESFVLFYSAGRPDNLAPDGRVGDLYITFRDSQGRWSEPQNLGRSVNSTGEESTPSLSPDGRYLFFASNRSAGSRLPDIYWVDAAFLPAP
ncbi:MAG: PD40 domain-containing protein, partial [Anaerolineae bacterium]|nr:PD40 domain-containing protein [Anaerolineae bacterium]